MSSVLKKGGGAFKPKAPIARRRVAAPSGSPPLTQTSRADTRSPSIARSSGPQHADIDIAAQVEVHAPTPPPTQAKATSAVAAATEQAENNAQDQPTEDDALQNQLLTEINNVNHTPNVIATPPASVPAQDANANAQVGISQNAVPSVEHRSATFAPAPSSTSKTAPKRGRKRKAGTGEAAAAADEAGLSSVAEGQEQAGTLKPKRAPRKKKPTATTEADGDSADAISVPKKARARKKGKATEGDDDGNVEAVRTTTDSPGAEVLRNIVAKKRSVTPEDAEERTVDHKKVKMGELTRDLRIGAKFSRHDELRKRRAKKRAEDRLLRLGRPLPGGEAADDDNAENDDSSPTATPEPETTTPVPLAAPSYAGPQLQLINGQIAIDPASLTYDRHAATDAANAQLETVEEDEWTRAVNNATYMKPSKKGPNHWSNEDTVTFYKHLRMFGTDLGTITKMFGGRKSRREVKLKFNREERLNPAAINRAIVGPKRMIMNMDVVRRCSGVDFEESRDILAELERHKEQQDAARKKTEEEAAEEARKKKEELFAPENNANGTDEQGNAVVASIETDDNGVADAPMDPSAATVEKDVSAVQTAENVRPTRTRRKAAKASGFGS